MNTFNIEIITRTPQKRNGLIVYWARINIGNFSERFVLPISSWSLDHYKMQWQNALEHFKQYNESCFATSVENLKSSHPKIVMWTTYKDTNNNQAIFRNNLMLAESSKDLPLPLTKFSESTYYRFIRSRGPVNDEGLCLTEDGYEVSEWTIPLDDLLSQTSIFKSSEPEFEHSPFENRPLNKDD